MAIVYTEWKPWPQDLGYTQRIDHLDGGQRQQSMDPVVGGSTQSANLASIITKAQNAIAVNKTFLALGSPTNAQTLAQVQALTKMVQALILLNLHEILGLTDISGT